MTLSAVVRGVSVWGPGLEGWEASAAILSGDAAYVPAVSPPPAPGMLPAAERRRAGAVVRLALATAHEAAMRSALDANGLDAVFASSNGDGPVVTTILEALAAQESARVVSPTQFHNSVHNAAAGYWSIATASRRPATCIGCHDESWAACLLTGLAGLRVTGAPVLLCCYDHPLPTPLDAMRPTGPAFSVALVLAVAGDGPRLTIEYEPEVAGGEAVDARYGALALNPAARALPLLRGLASGRAGRHALAYGEGSLGVELSF